MDRDAYIALWGAVLQVAIDDAQRSTLFKILNTEQRMSVMWITCDDTEPRSFLWVCDICGVDPARVRRMINA